MIGNRGTLVHLVIVAGLMFLGLNALADDKPVVKKEFAPLQGRWERRGLSSFGSDIGKLMTLMCGGKDRSKEKLSEVDYALEITGDVFTFGVAPGEKATAKIRPMKKPSEIDLIDSKGRVWQGLYELKDNDLKVTFSEGDWRPTKMLTKAEYGTACVHYKRVKSSKKQDAKKRS